MLRVSAQQFLAMAIQNFVIADKSRAHNFCTHVVSLLAVFVLTVRISGSALGREAGHIEFPTEQEDRISVTGATNVRQNCYSISLGSNDFI
jgi:hypothetical protein